MFSDAEPARPYLLLACILAVVVLLLVIAEHIDHSGQQHLSVIAPGLKASGVAGSLVKK